MTDATEDKIKELAIKTKDFFKSSGKEKEDMEQQRKKALHFLQEKKMWLIYVALGAIIWFGSYIRTRNLRLLRDVTTGDFVPLALDPHLFLKYARYIVEYGSLAIHDATRFVPLGTSTVNYVFMSSFIAYLYKLINLFVPSATIAYVAVIYPVICFAIAMLFFFLLVQRLFDWKVGLLSALFLSTVPAFLHRTMAGFSDHEALGIMLMFMAMYFYVLGWQSKGTKNALLWGVLAGLFTGFMGLSWGGWKFLILIISVFVLIEFFFNKLEKKDVYQYVVWVIAFVVPTTLWIPQFSLKLLLGSVTTGIAFLVLFMLLVDLLLVRYDLFKVKRKLEKKVPLSVVSLVVSAALGILVLLIILGPSTLVLQVEEISDNLLHPLGNDRWQLTVAEQHQPYFTTWVGHFGPQWFSVPLYLAIFMLGSIILFYNMVRKQKQQLIMTVVFLLFLLGFIMSRHSPDSLFNGTNFISKLVYLGSLAVFVGLGAVYFFYTFYKDRKQYEEVVNWDKKYIFVLVWFLLMVIAARGAARLFFIFAPITALMAGYAVAELGKLIWKLKNNWYKVPALLLLVLLLLSPFSFPAEGVLSMFSEQSIKQATYSGPAYSQHWQHVGNWVRENIPEGAVFGHWWDYGYWVQNGFRRASVLDGANKIKYWNYLMGRHVLTAQTQQEALEFLNVHKTTHFLIVSDEIGKYTAYSSIGSDENYDRYSWITTMSLNPEGTRETRNTTTFMFQGGYALDDDFVWEGKVYARQRAGVGAVFLPVLKLSDENGSQTIRFEQPTMALVDQGQRVDVPLKCVYFNKQMIKWPGEGYDGCLRLMPTIGGGGQVEHPFGAGLFISEEGVRALWVNMYVFEGNNPDYDTSAFELVYGEDETYAPLSVYQGRLIGPIKIWQINYPEGFTVDEETKAKYLGGNELLPDYFFAVN